MTEPEPRDQTIYPASIPPIAIGLGMHVVSVRDYLASQHLWTARREAWLCRTREKQLVADSNGNLDRKHRSYATTAALSSVAFLEGVVNASWQDAFDEKSTVYTDGIPESALATMRELWRGTEQYEWKALLEKSQAALELAGSERMPNRDPYQSVKVLIRLRNALVHFKPETRRPDTDADLEQRLKTKITKRRENQAPIGHPWFPNKALGAGTAQWACDSCIEFARQWHQSMGLTYDFDDLYLNSTGAFEVE
jgi:hypothetical protein